MRKIFLIALITLCFVSCSDSEIVCDPNKGEITEIFEFEGYPRRFDNYPVENKTLIIIYKTQCGETRYSQVIYEPYGLPPPPPPLFNVGDAYP
jgi:hypothetical protein